MRKINQDIAKEKLPNLAVKPLPSGIGI